MDGWLPFDPPLVLRNPHAMTLVPRYWPRGMLLAGLPQESRLFQITPDTHLLGFCHWQPERKASGTIVLVHGLEGCSESHYMHGIAAKAWRAGLNVIRLNQRTCGGTERLTPTLYNSGLSGDYKAVVSELAYRDGLDRIWLVGFSMGGNLVLKMAGEVGTAIPTLRGILAVCPNIDPTQCIAALERPSNRIYHDYFLRRLKARIVRKAAQFPGRWDLGPLKGMTKIRDFDDRYTAPDAGYRSAAEYYDRAGARHVMARIQMPTLIITAQDDPFIPYSMFLIPAIQHNPHITLVAPRYGGHCGFFQRRQLDEDRYWVENRLVEAIIRSNWEHST